VAVNAAWKKFEARFAAFFGALRRPLSGNRSGRDDLDGGDSTHPVLFLEAKLKGRHGVYRIWDKAREEAARKPIAIGLQEKNRPGFLVVAHSYDWRTVVVEWLKAQSDEDLIEIEHRVRGGGHDER
jgi:hypothetical protein